MKLIKLNAREKSKAQLQMGETTFVIFFIVIIIMMGLVFYANVQQASLKEQKIEQDRLKLISQAHTMAAWPELQCSYVGITDFECIDRVKLDLLSNFVDDSRKANSYAFRYYADHLGRSSLVVSQIYPKAEATSTGIWIVYNNSGNMTSKESVYNPVNIYDPVSGRFYFGMMELAVYG
jgi:hypothetical protein